MSGQIKRVLITGGSAGLGKELCDSLADRGFDVTNIDRDKPAAESKARFIQCDLANRDGVDGVLATLVNEQAFDMVIFNAGISATGKFEEIDPKAHARVIEVNAIAPLSLCAGLLGADKIAQNGRLAFVSSLSHFTGYPGAASYAASKDTLAIYAKSIAKPLKKKGIAVTTAFPGPMKTDHAARHAPEGADETKRQTPQEAGLEILDDIFRGKVRSVPGDSPKLFAWLGRIAPTPMTYAMKRIIYNKLDKTVAD